MTTYFAQSSSNINASNVWNTAANGSGSYLTWPPASGDVLIANNKTITVNVDTNLGATGQVRNDNANGATSGGYFELAAGVTLTAKVYGSNSGLVSTGCVRANYSSGTSYIIGDIVSAGSGSPAVVNSNSGALNTNGNITSGTVSGVTYALNLTGNGTITHTGDVYGGGGTGTSVGVGNNGMGHITINGNVYGGVSGTVNNVAAINNSTGTLFINGTCTASSYAPAVGYGSSSQITVLTGPFLCHTGGMQAIAAANWRWKADPTGTYMQVRTNDLLSTRSLYTADSVGGNPSAANVRYGTTYGPASELTGTCHVPAAASVLYGVPVDATTGTVTITAADIRAALGLASANLDTQLADLPTAAENATAVWGAATRTLTESSGGGATAEDVWTYATRSLTEAPDVPTVEEIAAEVRTELTPELSRVANCATVESTGNQLVGLL